MTETQFTPEKGDADIAAYENVDLSQLNSGSDDTPPTEKKLETDFVFSSHKADKGRYTYKIGLSGKRFTVAKAVSVKGFKEVKIKIKINKI